MATDRDEQQRQQLELEEIRRSFAEMGARMGSLFEPAEIDEDGRPPALPAAAATPAAPPAPAAAPARPTRWAALALAVVFLAGGVLGWFLPRGQSDNSGSPPPSTPAVTAPASAATPPAAAPPPPRVTVPETCLETAEKGDQTIAYLIRNIRDNRLSSSLKSYTVASQACRKEASP